MSDKDEQIYHALFKKKKIRHFFSPSFLPEGPLDDHGLIKLNKLVSLISPQKVSQSQQER